MKASRLGAFKIPSSGTNLTRLSYSNRFDLETAGADTGDGRRPTAYASVDRVDVLSARPDYAALLYPVTTMREPDAHAGSRAHLLGPEPSAAAVDRRTPLLHVTLVTPPSFIVHALDGTIVPPENGIDWLLACRAKQLAVEAHFPQQGGHGFGVSLPSSQPGSLWPTSFAPWEASLPRACRR